MARPALISLSESEFGEFLFAPIGEDRNGMLLTVLSALARRDVDPWQVAAELTGLPGEAAIQRLVSLIAALPDGLSAEPDPRTIAARLIALLPRGTHSDALPRKMLLGVGEAPTSRVFVAVVILMALVLSAQFIFAHPQPPTRVGNTQVSVSGSVVPKMPMPNSGR